jgi:RNA polymerase sigma factor (TIGR02999 family)
MASTCRALTQLLNHWRDGDRTALDELMPLLYNDLRVLARKQLRRERPGHTLRPTALVHEAWLQLASERGIALEGTTHFLGIAARLMRQLLIQHARSRSAQKRGGAGLRVSLQAVEAAPVHTCRDLLALDEALNELAEEDPPKARIVEMRYFGGFTMDEIAAQTGVSVSTVGREMRLALAWIRHHMTAVLHPAV